MLAAKTVEEFTIENRDKEDSWPGEPEAARQKHEEERPQGQDHAEGQGRQVCRGEVGVMLLFDYGPDEVKEFHTLRHPVVMDGKPYLVPMTLRIANDFVEANHRHNGRTARDGGKWSCGVGCSGLLVGVAIVGNPLSATLMDGWTAEVLRVCTITDSPKGTCSMLYAACWRAWQAMGGGRIITYTLKSESGASLRGAGWRIVGETKPVKDGWRKNDHLNGKRTHSLVMLERKYRWQKDDGRYADDSKESEE